MCAQLKSTNLYYHLFHSLLNAATQGTLRAKSEAVLWLAHSSLEGQSLRVGLPEDQSNLLDVLAIMTAVETDNLHAYWHHDFDPSGCATATPLSLLNRAILQVVEPDTVDVGLFAVSADQNLNGADFFLRVHVYN